MLFVIIMYKIKNNNILFFYAAIINTYTIYRDTDSRGNSCNTNNSFCIFAIRILRCRDDDDDDDNVVAGILEEDCPLGLILVAVAIVIRTVI